MPCLCNREMYLLGYMAKDNRLYLGDKEHCVVSYSVLLSVLQYQTHVMRKDFKIADQVLPQIPREHRTRVANFLEKQVRHYLNHNFFFFYFCYFFSFYISHYLI